MKSTASTLKPHRLLRSILGGRFWFPTQFYWLTYDIKYSIKYENTKINYDKLTLLINEFLDKKKINLYSLESYGNYNIYNHDKGLLINL